MALVFTQILLPSAPIRCGLFYRCFNFFKSSVRLVEWNPRIINRNGNMLLLNIQLMDFKIKLLKLNEERELSVQEYLNIEYGAKAISISMRTYTT